MKSTIKGIGGHQSANMRSDEWLTPPELLNSLGHFDLDPCAPINRPWPMAKNHFTMQENGLIREWFGRVWLNPPYGKALNAWLEKLAIHQNGIALTFARTDTYTFQRHVFNSADSILFIEGRLHFYTVAGTKAKHNGGAPSVLISYGVENVDALEKSGIKGKHVLLNALPIIVVGISPTWKAVVSMAVNKLNGKAHLKRIYDVVEIIAPDKVHKNKFYKEKIRQTLRRHFTKVNKGCYVIDFNDMDNVA